VVKGDERRNLSIWLASLRELIVKRKGSESKLTTTKPDDSSEERSHCIGVLVVVPVEILKPVNKEGKPPGRCPGQVGQGAKNQSGDSKKKKKTPALSHTHTQNRQSILGGGKGGRN